MFGKLFSLFGGNSNPMYEGLTSDEKKQLKNPNGKGALESKLANRFLKSKDYDRAFYFANIGVEKGHKDSFMILATCYRDGLGVEKDDSMSIEILKKGKAKDNNCSYELGKRYKEGRGVKKNLDEALNYFCIGMYRPDDINDLVCDIYIEQNRTDKDSINFYSGVAGHGYKPAYDKLVDIAKNDIFAKWNLYHVCSSDPKGKFYNRQNAVQVLNEIEALGDIVRVAKIYEKGDNAIYPEVKKAIQLYLKAAKGGSKQSASRISRLFFCNQDIISQEDFLECANFAANKGDIVAQESLAYYYIALNQEFKNGKGEGYNWAFEAAKKNSGIGMHLLGLVDAKSGIGYQSDAKMWSQRARKRLTELAQQGDGDASFFLHYIFRYGMDADSPVDARSHPTYKENTIVCLKNAITLESAFKNDAQNELFKLTGQTC